MEIIKKMLVTSDVYSLGDQFVLNLKKYGTHTATVQYVKDGKTALLFDNVVDDRPFLNISANNYDYDRSDIKKWLDKTFTLCLPKEIREQLISVGLPSFGQIFGHSDSKYGYATVDDDAQFPYVKHRKERICEYNGESIGWWLRNGFCSDGKHGAVKSREDVRVVYVTSNGYAYCDDGACSYGIRPVLWLRW